MKLLIVVTSLLAVTFAQRPWYAGTRPIGYPDLANRFKEDGGSSPPSRPINNRFDEPNREWIPVDALGDYDLVHRVSQWPKKNRPFWLLNAQHIEAHRNTPGRGGQHGNNPQNLPSRFGGGQQNNNNNYPDPYYYYAFGYDDFGNPKFYHY